METFKLELFKEKYGYDFPFFYHLSENECEIVRKKLYKKFNTTDNLDLMQKIKSKLIFIENVDIDDNEQFSIRSILKSLGIERKEILINWFRFDNIDRMSLDDLSKYFDDIWFPAADDIEVFDESCSWFLSINHGGSVGFLKA